MVAENGRRALVTGAGQGMGAAIAQRLAAADVTVVVNDIRAERAEEVAARLPGAVPAVADVTDYAAVRKMVDEYGPLDILVNNAGNAGIEGLGVMGPFVETEPDEWERWIRVNLSYTSSRRLYWWFSCGRTQGWAYGIEMFERTAPERLRPFPCQIRPS